MRADAAALESILIRYGLDTGAESAAAASCAAASAAARRFDINVMRQPRSACLNHRVASAGLLRCTSCTLPSRPKTPTACETVRSSVHIRPSAAARRGATLRSPSLW